MLELSDEEFLKPVINILKTLIEKEDNMQKQIDNVSKRWKF